MSRSVTLDRPAARNGRTRSNLNENGLSQGLETIRFPSDEKEIEDFLAQILPSAQRFSPDRRMGHGDGACLRAGQETPLLLRSPEKEM